LSQIPFIVGLILLLLGRFRIGNIQAEGQVVRGVGVLLMLPLMSVFFMAQMLSFINGGTLDGSTGNRVFLFLIEISATIICCGVAYVMLKRASEGEVSTVPKIINFPSNTQKRPSRRKNLPPVLSIAQTADYLNISEDAVMELIEEGKLVAAKDINGWRVARAVLEELDTEEDG